MINLFLCSESGVYENIFKRTRKKNLYIPIVYIVLSIDLYLYVFELFILKAVKSLPFYSHKFKKIYLNEQGSKPYIFQLFVLHYRYISINMSLSYLFSKQSNHLHIIVIILMQIILFSQAFCSLVKLVKLCLWQSKKSSNKYYCYSHEFYITF